MKKHLLSALLTIASSTALTFAAPPVPQGRAAAEQALRNAYGNNAKFRIYEENNINGITVYTAAVDANGGEANATVTANGDLLDVGMPRRAADVPPAVSQLAQGIFASPPQLVNEITSNRFTARLKVEDATYAVDFDATGRILDISELVAPTTPGGQALPARRKNRSLRQQAVDNARLQIAGDQAEQRTTNRKSQARKAAAPNPNEEQQVRQQFTRIFNQDKIQTTEPDPDAPGFYRVTSTNPVGPGYAIINASGEVPEFRVGIPRSELPAPVQQSLATLFRQNQLVAFERGSERIYRVNEVAANQRVDMWVRSDGDVVAVNEPVSGPQPAAARQPARR
jgi:hypothetical protein